MPFWLEDCTDNLVPTEVSASAHFSQDSDSEHSTKVATATKWRKHGIFTHFPKDRNCDVCLRTKITKASCRRRTGEASPRAEKFGDWTTADQKVLNEGCESRDNHRYAVVVQDLATQWIQSYPCKTKSAHATEKSLLKFLEPSQAPKVVYTDNSMEFGNACKVLSWNHRTSTPHRSETNGIAERAVRRVKEGTSAVLLQSGLDEKWWSDSKECYCYLRNDEDFLADGKTQYERRFGEPFKGPIIPFGAMVEYHPSSPKYMSRIHQFGKNVLPGIFLGSELIAEGIWKGDILTADLEDLEMLEASDIYHRRIKAKEVLISQKDDDFVFPVADGTAKLSGRGCEFRAPTLKRKQTTRSEDLSVEFQSELEESQPAEPTDDAEARGDFWSIRGDVIYRHHTEPRVQLYVPKEETFPIPLKYIDVTGSTHADLDVNDYWNVDSCKHVSDSCRGFTKFTLLKENTPPPNRIHVVRGRRLTKIQTTARPF